MEPIPKEIEERVKAKVQSMTLDKLAPPAYGEVCIARHGKHGITLACYEAYKLQESESNINRFGGMFPITSDMLEDVDDDFDIIQFLEKGIREMSYGNTSITNEDVRQWIKDFTNAFDVIDHLEEKTSGDKAYLKYRMKDALFLVAYVESQLGIEVEDEVYDRARELQMGVSDI